MASEVNNNLGTRQSQLVSAEGERGGLQVAFRWTQDRYAHVIQVRRGSAWVPVLSSDEGDEHEHWPNSPPFQQLTIEQRSAGQVGLLVGMAGASHWSGSAEAIDQAVQLCFDVACRVGESPSQLGSSYTLAPGTRCTATETGDILLDEDIRIRGFDVDGGKACVAIDDHRVTIRPQLPADVSLNRTIRWKYLVESRT